MQPARRIRAEVMKMPYARGFLAGFMQVSWQVRFPDVWPFPLCRTRTALKAIWNENGDFEFYNTSLKKGNNAVTVL